MAVSQIHFRSISLPSRLQKPIKATKFEAELQKLKSWQNSRLLKTVPVASEAIQSGLLGLAELYNSVEELKQFQATHQDEKSIEESIEGSVELLDFCNTIKELVQMIKENVQSLQSAFRRKGLDSSCIQSDITTYFCFRKKMNKCTVKSLKTLKNLENKIGSNSLQNEDGSFIVVLGEVTGITIAIFKCILMFLSWPMVKSGGWNLVSRLMIQKSMASVRDYNIISELGSVDFALNSLQGRVRNTSGGDKVLDMQMVQKLQNLDAAIEGFEAGLERLFRQLLRNRVTLLNILTDN